MNSTRRPNLQLSLGHLLMAFLIDTNVISETLKPRPAARVIAWFGDQRSNDLFLASMSLGELVRGAHRVKD